jgi:hypothetical protein
MLEHDPYRVIIAAEIEAGQVHDAHAALAKLGASVQVELTLCHYSRAA